MMFSFLPFRGKVRLRNPQHLFQVRHYILNAVLFSPTLVLDWFAPFHVGRLFVKRNGLQHEGNKHTLRQEAERFVFNCFQ